MLAFLANENIPAEAIRELRNAGFDVAWMREAAPGAPDDQVFGIAINENRLLLTFDKDFGELAVRSRGSSLRGVVLFRLRSRSSEACARMVTDAITSRSDWEGRFSVVESGRVRMTPLNRVGG